MQQTWQSGLTLEARFCSLTLLCTCVCCCLFCVCRTVENLAIVFAPSFLRNPSEDPAVIMNNTKFETKFTANLFRIVGEITWD